MAGQALALLDCRRSWALSGFLPQLHAHLPTWPSSWTFVQTQRHRDSKWGASCPPLLKPPHCSPDSVVPSSPQGDHPGAHWEPRYLPNTHIPVSPIMRNPYPPRPLLATPKPALSQTLTPRGPRPLPQTSSWRPPPVLALTGSSAPCRLGPGERPAHQQLPPPTPCP